MSAWSTVVLAAGLGKRMKSAWPKVLFPIAGRALVEYPVRAALELGSEHVVVVVSPQHRDAIKERLGQRFPAARLDLVVQDPARGTGDAARLGLEPVRSERVLILCGDTPLVQMSSLARLVAAVEEQAAELALLTALVADPTGYGRVLREPRGRVREIKEHRDCSDEERTVREVNAGMYVARVAELRRALGELTPANAQGEYYLTDTIALTARRGATVVGVVGDAVDLLGVNDRAQLAEAEELMFQRIAQRWGQAGVTVRGGARIDDTVVIEPDATIEHGARLCGTTHVGARAVVEVGALVADAELGAGARVGAYSVLTGAAIAAGSELPPFTRRGP
jgi:bifunctional UDP-N-acetylglucosamine pyrophosphorylase / glucosamine-1-phosphate N-acetyltransferase